MGPKKSKLELPPALTMKTRDGNKGKVVGAPDMPKPRKSHQEVEEEKEKKAHAKEQAIHETQEAMQRVAEIESRSREDAPTILLTQPRTPAPPRVQPLRHSRVQRNAKESTPQVPQTSGTDIAQVSSAGQIEQCSDESEPEEDASGPNRGEGQSEESEGSSDGYLDQSDKMDVDSGDEVGDGGHKQKKNSSHKGTRQVVGKRKPDVMADPETAPPKTKKAKARQNHSALHLDWAEIVKATTIRGRSMDNTVMPETRSMSRSSAGSSVPPSDSERSSTSGGDNITPSGAAIADDEETTTYPAPDNDQALSSAFSDIRGALRYRQGPAGTGCTLPDTISVPNGGDSEPQNSGSAVSAGATRIQVQARAVASPTVVLATAIAKVNPLTWPSKAGTKGKKDATAAKAHAVAKTSIKTPTGATSDDASAQFHSNTVPAQPGKPKLSHLPNILHRPFTTRFMPLTRQFLGIQAPWYDISVYELSTIHRKAFGEELSALYPLVQGDATYRLIMKRIGDWRTKHATTALETFNDVVLQDPEHAELMKEKANVAATVSFLLGDAKKVAPFYWMEWNGGLMKIGRLRHPLIIGTFAYHLAILQELDATERTTELAEGSLAMSVLAVLHTLKHYATGEWLPPDGRPGWFSLDNYGDIEIFQDGKMHKDKRLTRVMNVVKDLKDTEWTAIYEDAYDVVKVRQAQSKRGKKSKKGARTAASDAAEENPSDDELMLVADA